ncbi:hypothetical protein LCGC14_2587140, partial [marine sediment metagenome]
MKFYVNDGLAVTHGGKLYTEGEEFPAEELDMEARQVVVLLKEGSLIEEKAYRKKVGPTEEELKAEAEAEAEKAAAKKKVEADVLVVGGGLAGLMAAIRAKDFVPRVILVDKAKEGKSGCSPFAAGIYNAVLPEDNVDLWMK